MLLNSSDLLVRDPRHQSGLPVTRIREDQAEQNLVNSPQLYEYAANSVAGRAGTATEPDEQHHGQRGGQRGRLHGEDERSRPLTVDGEHSRDRVSTLARSGVQPGRRERDRTGARRDSTIRNTPDRAKQLQQLQTVRSLSAGETLFVEQATKATKQRLLDPAKDALLGGVIGLVIALLIVGARELFDTTVALRGGCGGRARSTGPGDHRFASPSPAYVRARRCRWAFQRRIRSVSGEYFPDLRRPRRRSSSSP